MPAKVRLHIFSGRPDPVWTISDSLWNELLRRSGSLQESSPAQIGRQIPERLGYKGFSIVETDNMGMPVPAAKKLSICGGVLASDAGTFYTGGVETENWLLATAPRSMADRFVAAYALSEFTRAVKESRCLPSTDTTRAIAPPYIPAAWNMMDVCPYNNCYNYSCDLRTDTYAQPGRAHGYDLAAHGCTSANTRYGAENDGLVLYAGVGDPPREDSGNHYVALAINPNVDYHWWRRDNDGYWSHKPGETAVIRTDNAGFPIANPQLCDRGGYTEFVGYFIVVHGHVSIQ